jgi:hypothetical protein
LISRLDMLEVASRAEERWRQETTRMIALALAVVMHKHGHTEARYSVTGIKGIQEANTITYYFDMTTNEFVVTLTPKEPAT